MPQVVRRKFVGLLAVLGGVLGTGWFFSLQRKPAMRARSILRKIKGTPTTDGAGVNMTRVIGHQLLSEHDPFLLLDEFRSDDPSDYIAGFPDHPHRGFQTVTYMLAGNMRHQDNKGHRGVIGPGSVQWMHAGSGIIHSEMPEQENGLMWGFQLWVNLPAKDKMTPADYYEYDAKDIPATRLGDAEVKVIAGKTPDGTEGPIRNIASDPVYLDITIPKDKNIELPIAISHNAFVYVFEGELQLGKQSIGRGEIALLGKGEGLQASTGGDQHARFLLIAGKPFREPIVRYGPFVMNTEDEIRQAIMDYRSGRF